MHSRQVDSCSPTPIVDELLHTFTRGFETSQRTPVQASQALCEQLGWQHQEVQGKLQVSWPHPH
jgi:predicted ATPase